MRLLTFCTTFAFAVGLTLSLPAAPAAAGGKEPPPPPPKKEDNCSPGFWKNHPETWEGICCDNGDSISCSAVDEALRARGPGSNLLREAADAFLEACVGDQVVCEDDD